MLQFYCTLAFFKKLEFGEAVELFFSERASVFPSLSYGYGSIASAHIEIFHGINEASLDINIVLCSFKALHTFVN